MIYVDVKSGKITTLKDRSQTLNCSIPAVPNPEQLKQLGLSTLVETEKPSSAHYQLDPVLKSGKWVQVWGSPEPTILEQIQREAFKAERAQAVRQIKVTTSAGNTFDGDETSQGRMARAILTLPDGTTVTWVLHDNTVIEATADELREALALAGAEQARLWVQG